jgi:hypothetical protein
VENRYDPLALYSAGGVAFGEAVDFVDGDAIEVAGNGVFERTGGDGKPECLVRRAALTRPKIRPAAKLSPPPMRSITRMS